MNANAIQISYHTLPCCATSCAEFSKISLIQALRFVDVKPLSALHRQLTGSHTA